MVIAGNELMRDSALKRHSWRDQEWATTVAGNELMRDSALKLVLERDPDRVGRELEMSSCATAL